MKEQLEHLASEAERALSAAADKKGLLQVKAEFLGRSGKLTLLIKQLGQLPEAERPAMGQLINRAKQSLEQSLEGRLAVITAQEQEAAYRREEIDITLPGRTIPLGKRHPVTRVTEEITAIFTAMGFQIAEGPEVELDFYNFEALNMPPDHPARAMHDTFYITEDVLLRTHTSPVQIRTMEKLRPPVSIISPGTAYRRDSDVSHTPMFHQVEGFMVGESISFSHLKGVLTVFARHMFGDDCGIRFRPSFSPSLNPARKLTYAASSARAPDAGYAPGPAGWKSSARAWSTPPSSGWSGMIPSR